MCRGVGLVILSMDADAVDLGKAWCLHPPHLYMHHEDNMHI